MHQPAEYTVSSAFHRNSLSPAPSSEAREGRPPLHFLLIRCLALAYTFSLPTLIGAASNLQTCENPRVPSRVASVKRCATRGSAIFYRRLLRPSRSSRARPWEPLVSLPERSDRLSRCVSPCSFERVLLHFAGAYCLIRASQCQGGFLDFRAIHWVAA